MAEIKGFSEEQRPIAIASLVVVTITVISLLIFSDKIGISSVPKEASSTPKAESQVGTSVKNENFTQKKEPTTVMTTTAPTTTQPMEFTVHSTIIIQGNRAMEIYSVAKNNLQNYSISISEFAKKVPDKKVHVMLAPTSIEFYGPEEYHTGNHSQIKGIQVAYDALYGDNITKINVLPEINRHKDEYLYFRTDHHWTARGAYYAYKSFCETIGITPTKLTDHKSGQIDDFVGSMYTYTSSDVLKDNPDYVEYFYPLTGASGEIYSDATMSVSQPLRIITENVYGRNKYLAFIEGDNPLEKITTENKNGKKIAVIKESYGNAFVPFLIDNFEEIYVIDPRRVDMNLTGFSYEHGITDILFINYPFVPSNHKYCEALNRMLQ